MPVGFGSGAGFSAPLSACAYVQSQQCPRLAAALALLVPALAAAQQQGVRGEATVTTTGGYGRIVIRTAAEVESQVRMTSGILVIQFRQPVTIAVDRLGAAASEYIGAARRDPDGRALRFALTQKVKVSSMTAGDRLFVDLLPESWSGEPPGLPREVVEELAKKANEAERAGAAEDRAGGAAEEDSVGAGAGRGAADIHPLHFRTAGADRRHRRARQGQADAWRSPRRCASICRMPSSPATRPWPRSTRSGSGDTSQVQFKFAQAADIRTFREDSNYVVDVSPIEAKPELKPAAAAVSLAGAARRYEPRRRRVPAKAADGQSRRPWRRPRRRTRPRCPRSPPAKTRRAPAKQPAAPPAPRRDPDRPVTAEMRRQGDNLRLYFPFAARDPGRGVPARRHAVAGVRHQGRDRHRRASATTRARPSAAPR